MNKKQILEEIRRTAAANGGTTVGFRRFHDETGIREADWKGRYWARWSDAVREAGYEANEMQAAHDEDAMLAAFARLARDIGRLPARTDMLMKRREDPTFPHPDAFSRRFGSKADAVAKLGAYCRRTEGWDDVAQLCTPTGALPAPEDRAGAATATGTVYMLRAGKHYKIGKTNAFGRRERELAIQLPERTTTVHVIRTDDPDGIEAYWHTRFGVKRKGGEWFDLDASDVQAFKRRKFM